MCFKTGITHHHKLHTHVKLSCLRNPLEIFFVNDRNLTFVNTEIIQPKYAKGKQCAAVHIRPTLHAKWIMVACDQPIPGATFVCESKINSTRLGLKNKTIVKANMECPWKTINILSTCPHVVNVLSRDHYNEQNICYEMDFNVFLLPSPLFSTEAKLAWMKLSPDETFLLSLLISMTHRWYTMFSQNVKNTDIILGKSQQTIQQFNLVGLQYSESNLAHVQFMDMNKSVLSSGMNILLCNHSMVLPSSFCRHHHAMCEDGTCILSHYVCDGKADCPDESDEHDCNHICSFSAGFDGDPNCFTSCTSPECVCTELYFACAQGGCVPWSRVCNALPDCPNGGDEQMCFFLGENSEIFTQSIERNLIITPSYKLAKTDYECRNGPNISDVLVDDLVPDCPEQDDEESYFAFLKNGSRPDFLAKSSSARIPMLLRVKRTSVCYRRHLHCVYQPVILLKTQRVAVNAETCRNGAHLRNCAMYTCPSFFKCPSAYCIPVYAICNGKADCPNGEDEENCQKISCPGFLLCRYDNVCVHPHDIWSGSVKCPMSLDDKALNGTGACPGLCTCLGNAIMCTTPIRLELPKLSTTIRLLVIRNPGFSLDNLQWKGALIALLHMQLSFCNISTIIFSHFRPLKFLQRLILHNNAISRLPNNIFQHLSSVKEIDLGHNLISSLQPSVFKGVHRLEILNLEFNKLTLIESCTFYELQQLTTLDLSNNYLTDLGDNIFCQISPPIRELHFGGNNLHSVDKRVLESHMQLLTYLNTTPLQICCFLPKVEQCFPTERFFLSTCRNLLGLVVRYALTVAGTVVVVISIGSAIWIFQSMRAKQSKENSNNRNLNNILNVLLFICHGLKGIHALTLAGVGFVFHDYYALHEEMWKRHVLCVLLNMVSYSSLMMSLLVYLLMSCTRMIACVFPFDLAKVSLTKIILSIVIFLLITLIISYLPYSAIGNSNLDDSQMVLGFGLVLPSIILDQSLWSLLGYVFPLTIILLVSSAFQIACIRTLCKKQMELKGSILSNRRGSIVRCVAALVLPLCCQMPLMLLHIAAVSHIELPPSVSVAVTMLTLYGFSVSNVALYVVATPAFIDFILRCIRRI